MSLGTILLIVIVIALLGGFSGDHHGDESNGAQFTHDVALQFGGLGMTTIAVGVCSLTGLFRRPVA